MQRHIFVDIFGGMPSFWRLSLLNVVLVSARDVVSFNGAWRFHLGDPPGVEEVCPPWWYTDSLDGFECPMGGAVYTPMTTSPDDCRRACCSGLFSSGCVQWRYLENSDPQRNVTKGCYLSDVVTKGCVNSSSIWRGAFEASGTLPSPPKTYDFASSTYNDSTWELLDVPHDFVIAGNFSSEAESEHGYLPRSLPGWYRKKFKLPQHWDGSAVALEFDGVFHVSRLWLNGHELDHQVDVKGQGSQNGYTGFVVPLRNSLLRPLGTTNTLAMRVDASFGSGHWYEGGGIYRNVRIVRSSKVHIAHNGVYARSTLRADHSSAIINVSVSVQNDFSVGVSAIVQLRFIDDATGRLAVGSTQQITLPGSAMGDIESHLILWHPKLWSIQSPATYSLEVYVDALIHGQDGLNLTIGLREAKFTAASGFHLNGKHVILRGFSQHNDFAGLGVALPARVNLYRAQMLRAVGGNVWRMSHNPGDPQVYDLLDTLGIMVWDENRDFTRKQVTDMVDLVSRDRNHPSVIVWSYCNEVECHENSNGTERVGLAMRHAAMKLDDTRPFAANLNKQSSQALIGALDVFGLSHNSNPLSPMHAYVDVNYSYKQIHKAFPNLPIVSSEGSSCLSTRGVNRVNKSRLEYESSFNGDCLSKRFCPTDAYKVNPTRCQQSWTTAYSKEGKLLPFVAGNLGVWTLFDYLGEPTSYLRGNKVPAWPQVSSTFGSFDLAGFAKPAAWYYRAWWLCNVEDEGRPPLPSCNTEPVVKIVQDWRGDPTAPDYVAVYSNAPRVELLQNGKSLGICSMRFADYCRWKVSFMPGNVTALALDEGGHVLSSDVSVTPGPAVRIQLSLDMPHMLTGTGSSLVADGQDVALVRASLVDAGGRLASGATGVPISFAVQSGPGLVVGVGNGDPMSHEPNLVSQRTSFHGLARGIVRVISTAALEHADLRAIIDVEAHYPPNVEDITVVASGPGLVSNKLRIPISTSMVQDGALAVARRSLTQQLKLDLELDMPAPETALFI